MAEITDQKRERTQSDQIGKTFRRVVDAIVGHPERVYALLATVFGLIMVFLVPPFQPPDEHPHFFRAYQISRGGLVAKRNGSDFGGELPVSFYASAKEFIPLFYHAERKVDLGLVERMLQMPQEPEKTEFVDFKNTAPYAPTTYVPAAVAIGICNLFKPSPIALLYLTRLFCLAAFVAMLAFAIKLMPSLKWMAFLLALMPTTVAVSASVSGDTIAIGSGFLFVAFCFNLAFVERERMPRSLMIGLVVSGVFLAMAKFAYAPMLLLCLIIPQNRFASKRKYWAFVSSFLVGSAILYIAWLALVLSMHVSTTDQGGASEQLRFILSNPLEYARIFISSHWRRQLSLPFTFVCTIGHVDTMIGNLHFIFYLFTLFFCALIDRTKGFRFSRLAYCVVWVVVVCELVAIPTMLYVNSCPIGGPDIIYIGGRYLVPFSVLIFALFYNRSILTLKPRWPRFYFAGAALLSLVGMIITVFQRYYG